MNNFMLPKMLDLFPEARFIHLVRNGVSVALSWQKKERTKYQDPIYRPFVNPDDASSIRFHHAKCWNDSILRVEQDRQQYFSNRNFLEVRYEDLVGAPHDTVGRMLNFIGLEMSESPVFVGKINALADKNYKAVEQLEEGEVSALQAAMRPALNMKGYL